MNIPNWLVLFLTEYFNGAQVRAIAANWYRYNQLSLSNASREELLDAARCTLRLCRDEQYS